MRHLKYLWIGLKDTHKDPFMWFLNVIALTIFINKIPDNSYTLGFLIYFLIVIIMNYITGKDIIYIQKYKNNFIKGEIMFEQQPKEKS